MAAVGAWIVVFSGQAAGLLLVAAVAGRLGRLRPAAARLAYWRLAVAATLLLPALPGLDATRAPAWAIGLASRTTPAAEAALNSEPATMSAWAAPSLASALAAALLVGMGVRVAWLLIGCLRLRTHRKTGRPLEPFEFDDLRRELAPSADVRWQDGIAQPATFGFWKPVVLLPTTLRDLPAAAQRAVVCHELVHVARRDWLWQLGEEAVRTAFWFHPPMRWALAQVQLAREQVVDAAAVRRTGARQSYMSALLRFAEPATAPPAAPAIAFVRHRHLAQRIRELAREDTMSIRRTALVGFLLCGVIAASGWTIAHALPLPDLQAQMAFVPKVNQTGPIKRATTTVNAEYPPEARGLGISADVSVGVTVGPAGDVLDAKAVAWGYHVQGDDGQGRAAFLAAEPIDRRFVNAAERAARLWRFEAGDAQWTTGIKFEFLAVGDNELVQVSSPNALPPLPAPGEPLRVGGSLKPPRMVKKVNPVYPAEARAGRVQGVVVIEARIGRDGSVVGTRVLRSVPLLDQAAIDAVRQWKYEPTVVDGEPVELLMVVTVNFSSTPAS